MIPLRPGLEAPESVLLELLCDAHAGLDPPVAAVAAAALRGVDEPALLLAELERSASRFLDDLIASSLVRAGKDVHIHFLPINMEFIFVHFSMYFSVHDKIYLRV